MSKYGILFYVFFYVCSASMAQTNHHCGSEAYMQHLQTTNPNAYKQINAFQHQITNHQQQQGRLRTTASTDTIIKIPVVVHVIHNNAAGIIGGSTNTNITDAQIFSQIDVLNRDYLRLNADTVNTPAGYKPVAANVKLTFCLANVDPNGLNTNGITRTYNNKSSYTVSDAPLLSSLAYWPSDSYLNIWVCNISGSIIGFAQPPGSSLPGLPPVDGAATTDGVTIDFKAFGTTGAASAPFNFGRTTTHEVGHWFGLLHPWGGYDSDDCSLTDYCNDTPVCGNGFESAYPTCSNIPTGLNAVVCTPDRMIENFMDYSNDGCMNLFTTDQKSRMRTAIELSPRRFALLSSLGCCTVPNLIAAPYQKTFEDGSITSDGWSTINPNSSSSFTKGFELNNTSAYGIGNYSTSVTNDSVYIETNAATHKYVFSYISPFFTFQHTIAPQLRFDWAYSPLTTNGNTDSIIVYIASGCENNWIPIHTFYGAGFTSTINPRASFIPTATEWATMELDVSAYINSAGVRIKFVAYSKGINTFYLDNINIANTSSNLLATVYPNPTTGLINVSVIFEGKQTINYIIYNVLGQLIYQGSDENVYSYIKQINLEYLASGVYFIQVSKGDQKIISKIIKE
jgi:hypothetical protein